MATLEEDDIVEDDSFRTVLTFPPEVQEAIDQVGLISVNEILRVSGCGLY